MLNINDFFCNLKKYLIPGIHYISIGCANYENLQFPSFLDKKKPITLVLIDPLIESVPICLKKSYDIKNNYYITDTLRVFWFNESVEYEKYLIHFINYNNFILQSKSLLFVHDYSGRPFYLANLMDNIIGRENMKYIMYDIDLRREKGIDVTNVPIIESDYEIFNPHMYDIIPKNISDDKKKQFKNITEFKLQLLHYKYFEPYRIYSVLKNKIIENKDIDISTILFNTVNIHIINILQKPLTITGLNNEMELIKMNMEVDIKNLLKYVGFENTLLCDTDYIYRNLEKKIFSAFDI